MQIFPALLALCEGNPPVTGGFLSQRPVTRSFDVFFDLRLKTSLRLVFWHIIIHNRLLKLLLRLDPYTNTNLLHNELDTLKVSDPYNISLLLFVHANLQGDCPAAVKNYLWEEIMRITQDKGVT